MRTDVELSDVFVSWTSDDRILKDVVVRFFKEKNLKYLDADEKCCVK